VIDTPVTRNGRPRGPGDPQEDPDHASEAIVDLAREKTTYPEMDLDTRLSVSRTRPSAYTKPYRKKPNFFQMMRPVPSSIIHPRTDKGSGWRFKISTVTEPHVAQASSSVTRLEPAYSQSAGQRPGGDDWSTLR